MNTSPADSPAFSLAASIPAHSARPNLLEAVESIAVLIEKYVFLKDKCLYRFLAYWIINTYIYKQFEFTGYVNITSPDSKCGKTNLLSCLQILCHKCSDLEADVTKANLFREIDDCTQLIDEMDALSNTHDMKAILNSGFRRGGVVSRCDDASKSYKRQKFPTYCPRAFAGIGTVLTEITLSRCFTIPLNRQPKSEGRKEFFKDVVELIAQPIRAFLIALRSDKTFLARIHNFYVNNNSALPYLQHLEDRAFDITKPLAALLETVYEGDAELPARRKELLEAVAVARGEGMTRSKSILRALHHLAYIQIDGIVATTLVGSSSEIIPQLQLDPPADLYEFAFAMREYGFKTRSVRGKGGPVDVRQRYTFTLDALTAVCDRHGCPWSTEDGM